MPWSVGLGQQNLPQIRLEPLLKARAEELSPGRIRFGHELTGLEQDGEGVRATVRDNASGRQYVVRCQYLIGADGGRRVAGLVGVEYEGLRVVTQTATLHVSADFSPWAKDPDVLIRWIYSPQAGVLVVMVPMGPQRWGPESEEWVIHLNYPVDDPRAQSDAQVEADAREALGIPAVAGKRGQPLRDRRGARPLPRQHPRAEHGAAAPDVERPARGRRASRWTCCGSATLTATTTTRAVPGCATGGSPATARSWSARTGSSPGESPVGGGEPRAALAAALSQILARPVDAPVASAV